MTFWSWLKEQEVEWMILLIFAVAATAGVLKWVADEVRYYHCVDKGHAPAECRK